LTLFFTAHGAPASLLFLREFDVGVAVHKSVLVGEMIQIGFLVKCSFLAFLF